MRDTERKREAETGRGRSRVHAPEPDMGFDPGSPGPCPGPKADAQPLSHPGVPNTDFKTRERLILPDLMCGI